MPDSSAHQTPPPHRGRVALGAFGGYEIEGELGRGGMGVVYLARQLKLNRRVALKMLTGHYGPEELQRFVAEAETAAGLHHTNIAQIYEVGEHDGSPYFSMEHVEGGSLADRLRQKMPTPRESAQLLISIARALHFAHQNGVVHRDMKPGNVLLDADGIPKVTDFGIAKRLSDTTHLTLSGAIVGTPTYMSPEQARGSSRDVGPAADVYSLGAIFYEMLAGRPPFLPEESTTAVTVRVLTEDPVSPAWHRPEIPRDLEVICMKCLEKEPGDRYVSAAAFAEDLRRFLDDESIVARPPTTVIRTIKWIRRHPWKFVTRAALFLLLIAGSLRLGQWELYERPHIEYGTRADWVNGVLEPFVRLDKTETTHHPSYLRLTRRGRRGLITKIEVLNPRGHPAVLRQFYNDEAIPLYIEGLMGSQPYMEKAPESTTVDFLYDGPTVSEALGRDLNGNVNWRILYDHPVADSAGQRMGRARFVNLRGFDANSRNGASHMEFERDAAGHDVKVTFFNAAGQPAANGEGVFGYRLERDPKERLLRLINLGNDGHPAANRGGITALSLTWNPLGQMVRADLRDGANQPVLWNGVAALITEYDTAGNSIRITKLGENGKPILGSANDWSIHEIIRNEHGEIVTHKYLKADATGKTSLLSQTTAIYDDFGYISDLQFSGPTTWRTAMSHDGKGNITEEKYLDGTGKPITGDKGYAIKRFTYNVTQQGLRIDETYHDANGKDVFSASGHHRLINEFSTTGMLQRQTMEDNDPARFSYYRYVSEPEFDQQSRIHRNVFHYEDKQGHLATQAGLAYTTQEVTYDTEGREMTDWKLGCHLESFGAPVMRTDTEWHSTGARKKKTRQACDENRQPLAFISNGTAAHYEEEFDALNHLERIYETGFDEKRCGFSSRETHFTEDILQSVIHKRSDGNVLPAVQVIITGVVPSSDQPNAAKIKVGDQFITSNGQPITNAYAWVYSGVFPGGWIEVLRDGQRIRIEDLQAAPLGVILEDRAPR